MTPEELHDPQVIEKRKHALAKLKALPGMGGRTGLVTTWSASYLLGVSTYAIRRYVPTALEFNTREGRARLYDPVVLLRLYDHPAAQEARARLTRRLGGRPRVQLEAREVIADGVPVRSTLLRRVC